jgi:RNA polymerase sigma factor (sigma-70 family)
MSSCSMVSSSFVHHIEPTAMGDDMLVAAAQDGQEWAFVELCTRNSKRVFNTIYGVTKNREDAEDALQDSMMRAFLHLKQFDGRSSFATWFTRIGINSALMILRKRRIRLETSMDATADGEPWQSGKLRTTRRIPSSITQDVRGLHLKRAICSLPNALRLSSSWGRWRGIR